MRQRCVFDGEVELKSEQQQCLRQANSTHYERVNGRKEKMKLNFSRYLRFDGIYCVGRARAFFCAFKVIFYAAHFRLFLMSLLP